MDEPTELPALRIRHGDFEVEYRSSRPEDLRELLDQMQPLLEFKRAEAAEAKKNVGQRRTGF